MRAGTMVPYAEKRVKQHINRFNHLYEGLKNRTVNLSWLEKIEARDNIFSDMNCAQFYLQEPYRAAKESESSETDILEMKTYCNINS